MTITFSDWLGILMKSHIIKSTNATAYESKGKFRKTSVLRSQTRQQKSFFASCKDGEAIESIFYWFALSTHDPKVCKSCAGGMEKINIMSGMFFMLVILIIQDTYCKIFMTILTSLYPLGQITCSKIVVRQVKRPIPEPNVTNNTR